MQCTKCESGLIKIGNGYNRCDCRIEKVVKKLFKLSDTPDKFYKLIEDFKKQKVKTPNGKETSNIDLILNITNDREKVKKLMDREVKIILKGNPGSGKTQTSVTIALQIMKQFDLYQPILETNRFYFLDVRNIGNWMFNNEEKEKVFEKVRKSNVLIIDDLGTENYKTLHITNALDEMVRQFNGITIITTNIDEPKTLYDSKNKRLSDVLFPNGEKDHGKFNALYYYLETPKGITRRMNKVEDLDLI